MNVGRVFGRSAVWGEIVARAERSPRRFEDDDTDAPVGLSFLHRVEQLAAQLVREGIELLGPVQRDDREPLVLLIDDVVVRHRLLLLALWWRLARTTMVCVTTE